MSEQDSLTALVSGCGWLMELLRAVEEAQLPDAWVGAGVLRDLVWDTRFGSGFDPRNVKDVDVAFFDPADLSPARDDRAEASLRGLRPDVHWDAKNQAAVHLWYPARFGVTVEPLTSSIDGVATWPETATAVAIRLDSNAIQVASPLGLSDLLCGVWRRNPARVTVEEYNARIERKRPSGRWPGVTVVEEPGAPR
jgi:hypothetical protein